MNERVFHGAADRLRRPERIALLELDRVVALSIEGQTAQSMLDVGTGTGVFAEAFAKAGLRVAGIDINEELLNKAQGYIPAGDFRTGSAEAIPFEDRSYDITFLGHVLHEADNLTAALGEARRVARMRVAVLEWPYIKEEMGPPLAHRLRGEDIEAAAQSAGFAKVETVRLQHMVLIRMDCV
jgi:ubiquinone/menaquinone biosynthesis C-methylase UbiE